VASGTISITVRTRNLWALRLAAVLLWTHCWPLIDRLIGAVRVEYRSGLTDWRDTGARLVRDGREIHTEGI